MALTVFRVGTSVEDAADDAVRFHGTATLNTSKQIDDRRVDQARTLLGKHPRAHPLRRWRVICLALLQLLLIQLHGETNILGVATIAAAISRLLHRYLNVGSAGNDS